MRRIAFGCDHVGFILKEEIMAHLNARGVEVVDKGRGHKSERITHIMPALLPRPLSMGRLKAVF
jgi:ribose 5-phosphate isomerase RpiB